MFLEQSINMWKDFIDRLPGWPGERQVVMGTTFLMGFVMLFMANYDPTLWNVELFKTLITVIIVTGCVNMILAFHFSANKGDETKAENTGKAFDAITATAQSTTTNNDDPSIIKEGDDVTLTKKD